MGYRILTTAILGLHFAFVAYVIAGGFLAWRWPRTIWPHLLAGGWGFAVVAARLACPLTYAEDWSRRRAGEPGLTQGFIDRYIDGVIYPVQYAGLAQALAAALVMASWIGYVVTVRKRRRHDRGVPQVVRTT
jgi:hypothetical protein